MFGNPPDRLLQIYDLATCRRSTPSMKMRLLIAAFALAGLLGSGQSLAQNAYITNAGSNNVSVIDTATNTVTATITVGSVPVGVAISPDGTRVYVTNSQPASATGTASVIDTASNTAIATIPVGLGPNGIAVTPDGNRVY